MLNGQWRCDHFMRNKRKEKQAKKKTPAKSHNNFVSCKAHHLIYNLKQNKRLTLINADYRFEINI